MIRLFYCPICGVALLLPSNDKRFFFDRSPQEVAELTERVKSVTSIDLALKHLGHPDVDQGPWAEDTYPKGQRTRIGSKRALFYSKLAKTVTVAVIEWIDGSVDVKFYPKERL